MEKISPPEKKVSSDASVPRDKLVALRCPYCVSEGKNGVVGEISRRRLDLVVQNAITSEGAEALADVILTCDTHKVRIVYMLTLLPSPG